MIRGHVQPLAALSLALLSAPLLADNDAVECGRGESLSEAIAHSGPGESIKISGVCRGGVVIAKDGLTLDGQGKATVEGQGRDAITIDGASRVTLKGLEVRGGSNGVVAKRGAHVILSGVRAHDNAAFGILVEFNSSADISDSSTQHNGVNGLDLESNSSVQLSGDFSSQDHTRGFGIFINSSSSANVLGNVSALRNVIGIQVGNGSSAFLVGPKASLSLEANFSDGLTIVSNSHLFAFGGSIDTHGNGLNGISAFSKSGIDADAAAKVTAHDNAFDGIHLEEISLFNLFNTPAFSGAPGTTIVEARNNGRDGVSAGADSVLHMFNQTALVSQTNARNGLFADNGSSVIVIQSNITNNPSDVSLAFGSRGDFKGNTIGKIVCDKTVLVRGDTGVACPTP
jgi:hypothetical protein